MNYYGQGNEYIDYVKQYREMNPNLTWAQAMKNASPSYHANKKSNCLSSSQIENVIKQTMHNEFQNFRFEEQLQNQIAIYRLAVQNILEQELNKLQITIPNSTKKEIENEIIEEIISNPPPPPPPLPAPLLTSEQKIEMQERRRKKQEEIKNYEERQKPSPQAIMLNELKNKIKKYGVDI